MLHKFSLCLISEEHKSGYLLSALSVYQEFLAPKDDGKEAKLEREIEVRFKICS